MVIIVIRIIHYFQSRSQFERGSFDLPTIELEWRQTTCIGTWFVDGGSVLQCNAMQPQFISGDVDAAHQSTNDEDSSQSIGH